MGGTIVVLIILIVVLTVSIMGVIKRIKYGSSCCGERDAAPSKIKVKDKNKSHYPNAYSLKVDGMHCSGCVRKIENEFNKNEGMWAKADLENKRVKLLSKNTLDESIVSKIVSSAGFTMLSFEVLK